MKIIMLTNEYPPNVYGGAGVHIEHLARELAGLDQRSHSIQVFCFGRQELRDGNLEVRGVDGNFQSAAHDLHYPRLMQTLFREVIMAGSIDAADIVHCHTWYTHLAGCLLKQLLGARLVLTTHSLEPHRPWKAEQIGAAYHASSWMERTAYENADGIVAVSKSMREDVHRFYRVSEGRIRVIYNGVDLNEYRHHVDPEVLKAHGINPDKPFILFVGRITRQKGIAHLVHAIKYILPYKSCFVPGLRTPRSLRRRFRSASAGPGKRATTISYGFPESFPSSKS